MRYEQTITIPQQEAAELQAVLNGTLLDDLDEYGTYETLTAVFGGGVEVDIKICNGDGPYIDAVIFRNSAEIYALDDCKDILLGEYYFEVEGDEYVVYIETE